MIDNSIPHLLEQAIKDGILTPGWAERLSSGEVVAATSAETLVLLVNLGGLTAYQAECLTTGRLNTLRVGPFVILQPTPLSGGEAFVAHRMGDETPVQLLRLQDTADRSMRVEKAAALRNAHTERVLDVSRADEHLLIATPATQSATLKSLVDDMGPMPLQLAVEYIRQAAFAVAAAHAVDLVHGHVNPTVLKVGPLVASSKPRPDGSPRMRPAATAILTVTEFAVDPRSTGPLATHVLDYLPTHADEQTSPTQATDVYSLAACLYYALTAHRVTFGPLELARPDCPKALVRLFKLASAERGEHRPSAARFADDLQYAMLPPTAEHESLVSPSNEVPIGAESSGEFTDFLGPVANSTPVAGWDAFSAQAAANPTAEVYTPSAINRKTGYKQAAKKPYSRKTIYILITAFVMLNLIAVTLLVLSFVKPFGNRTNADTDKKSTR